MRYRLHISPEAERQYRKLPKSVQRRIARWLDLLVEDPLRPPSKQLRGHPELRRIHAGKDYVILYSIHQSEVVVVIVGIDHRRNVYRRL